MHGHPTAPKRRKRAELSVKDAKIAPVSGYGKSGGEEWKGGRFQHWQAGSVAVMSGSTYAEEKPNASPPMVDATAMRAYEDEDGVLQSVIAVTVTGYNPTSPEEIDAVSSDNQLLISEVDKAVESVMASSSISAIEVRKLLTTVGQEAYQKRKGEEDAHARALEKNGSAIAATIIEYDANGMLFPISIGNIGDTMVVVLDGKTGKMKGMLGAKQYQSEAGESFHPMPTHLVEANLQALQSAKVRVAPGDIVIQMTDGIFRELLCTEKTSALPPSTDTPSAVKEIKLQPNALEKVLELKQGDALSAHEIAAKIQDHISAKIIRERIEGQQKFDKLIQCSKDIQNFIRDSNEALAASIIDHTIGEILDLKISDESPLKAQLSGIYETLRAYWPDLQQHHEFKGKALEDVKLTHVHRYIDGLVLKDGDCAMLSVIKVPDPDVELIRALVVLKVPEFVDPAEEKEILSRRERLLSRIRNRIEQRKKEDPNFNAEQWEKNIIAALKAEDTIQPGSRRSEIQSPKELVYNSQQLDIAESFIQNVIHQYNSDLDAAKLAKADKESDVSDAKAGASPDAKKAPKKPSVVDKGENKKKLFVADQNELTDQMKSELRKIHEGTIALLDVDGTLLGGSIKFGDYSDLEAMKATIGENINIQLISALITAGITDLYLFTNMGPMYNTVRERDALVSYLRDRGFKVHGVISPMDKAWKASKEELADFYEQQGEIAVRDKEVSSKGKMRDTTQAEYSTCYTALEDKISESKDSNLGVAFDSLKKAAEKDAKETQEAQRGKRDAKEAQGAKEDAKEAAQQEKGGVGVKQPSDIEHGQAALVFMSIQARVKNFVHIKGEMLLDFLKYFPQSKANVDKIKAKKAVVFDDEAEALYAISESAKISARPDAPMEVSTFYVNNFKSPAQLGNDTKKTELDYLNEMTERALLNNLRINCKQYLAHLNRAIGSRQLDSDSSQAYSPKNVALAKAKKQKIEDLYALINKPTDQVSVRKQLDAFVEQYERLDKTDLTLRHDHFWTTLGKVLSTAFFGVGYLAGVWKVPGKEFMSTTEATISQIKRSAPGSA